MNENKISYPKINPIYQRDVKLDAYTNSVLSKVSKHRPIKNNTQSFNQTTKDLLLLPSAPPAPTGYYPQISAVPTKPDIIPSAPPAPTGYYPQISTAPTGPYLISSAPHEPTGLYPQISTAPTRPYLISSAPHASTGLYPQISTAPTRPYPISSAPHASTGLYPQISTAPTGPYPTYLPTQESNSGRSNTTTLSQQTQKTFTHKLPSEKSSSSSLRAFHIPGSLHTPQTLSKLNISNKEKLLLAEMDFVALSNKSASRQNAALNNGIEIIASRILNKSISTYSISRSSDDPDNPNSWAFECVTHHPDGTLNYSIPKRLRNKEKCMQEIVKQANNPENKDTISIVFNGAFGQMGHFTRVGKNSILDNSKAAGINLCFWAALFHNTGKPGELKYQPKNSELVAKRTDMIKKYFQDLKDDLDRNPQNFDRIMQDLYGEIDHHSPIENSNSAIGRFFSKNHEIPRV